LPHLAYTGKKQTRKKIKDLQVGLALIKDLQVGFAFVPGLVVPGSAWVRLARYLKLTLLNKRFR